MDGLRSAMAEIEGLRQEADQLGAALSVGLAPSDRYRGEDASGVVVAEIDGTGRFVDIDIAVSWKRLLGSTALPPATVEACTAAGQVGRVGIPP